MNERDVKVKTAYPNVRYKVRGKKRENGTYPDRAFYIRYRVDGKEVEELVGRASKGMTALKANQIVSQLVSNIANGKRPFTYKEWKTIAEEKRKAELTAERLAEKQSIPFGAFFENEYFPATKIDKANGSLIAESALFNKWIKPVLGEIPLTAISYSNLETIMKNMTNAGLSRSSIKYAFAVVSQVWAHGKLKGVCEGESPIPSALTVSAFLLIRGRSIASGNGWLLFSIPSCSMISKIKANSCSNSLDWTAIGSPYCNNWRCLRLHSGCSIG